MSGGQGVLGRHAAVRSGSVRLETEDAGAQGRGRGRGLVALRAALGWWVRSVAALGPAVEAK